MYENNNENNYTYTASYTPEEPEPPKNGGGKKAAKAAAMVLSMALVGGAAGFGGSYIANSMDTDTEQQTISETASETEETSSRIETVTAIPQTNEGDEDTSLGNLLNIDSKDSDELTDPEIIKKATPSVVLISSTFTEAEQQGTATGIVLSSDGYIITNCHVIQTTYDELVSTGGADSFYDNPFSFFNGGYNVESKTVKADKVVVTMSDESEHEAEIIGYDENTDLALLKIDAKGLIPAVIGDSDKLVMGERAITLGYPLGLGLSASGGMISGLEKELTTELSNGGTATMTLIQTDAAINNGNSGGPLLNSKGEVVGITSSKIGGANVDSVGFAIPITDAMPILDDLMNKGYVSTPKIGITGTDITPAVQRYYNLPVDEGVMVVSVEADSCAASAGIAEGDVIVAADGKDISSMNELVAAKNRHKPGETMTVTLARDDDNIDIEIVLDETPVETDE